EVNVAEVNGADCVVITQEEAAASGAQSSSSLATLQLGLTEVLAKEYQTQVQQSLVDMYVLPSHLIEVSEFNGVLIEAYFKQAKVLRADDFEKIYLNLENLASKQIQDNLYNLQQLLDTELEQLQEEVILRQEQLQRSIAHLQAQLPL
ncbi:MAG: hypothetical protein Q4G54_11305, partial [Pelistega sp.]|nr:hypothetical protein [Pelistega sp.]